MWVSVFGGNGYVASNLGNIDTVNGVKKFVIDVKQLVLDTAGTPNTFKLRPMNTANKPSIQLLALSY